MRETGPKVINRPLGQDVVGNLGKDAQRLGAVQEKLLVFSPVDIPGQVQEKFPVIAGAGESAAIAPLAAQHEIELLHIGLHLLRKADFAQVGQRLGAIDIPVMAVDIVDDGLLDHQRKHPHGKALFQFHIGRDLGLQVLRAQHRPLLHLHEPDQLVQLEIAGTDIQAQVHIGGEVPDRTAPIHGAQVHRDAHFQDARLPVVPIGPIQFLEGVQHHAGQEVGHGAVHPAADGLDGIHRQDRADIAKAGTRKAVAFDMIGGDILFQLPFTAGEDGLEAVLHLPGIGRLRRIQHRAGIGDAQAVFQTQVLAGEGQQEGLGARTVGQGVEDVQDDAVAIGTHLIKEAAVVAEVETVERGGGCHLGVLVHPAEVPPESPGAELAPEGGNPFGDREERLRENGEVHRFRQGNAHPVQGSIVLAQRSGINVRRVVNPHPGGNLESLVHLCLHWFCGKGTGPLQSGTKKVVKAAKM